jgi:hypothetical protein
MSLRVKVDKNRKAGKDDIGLKGLITFYFSVLTDRPKYLYTPDIIQINSFCYVLSNSEQPIQLNFLLKRLTTAQSQLQTSIEETT